MSEDIVVKIDRKQYRWHYDPDSKAVGTWADEKTYMAPTPQIETQLNRVLLDGHGLGFLEAWGKDDLPRFDAFLRSIGASDDDYIKLGLGFLVEPESAASPGFRSPLFLLGYKTGKSGETEANRRAILRRAVEEHLPNAGSSKYMASWGMPGTARRLAAISSHIRFKCLGSGGRPEADYAKADAEWRQDLEWLKVTFYDGKYNFPWLSYNVI